MTKWLPFLAGFLFAAENLPAQFSPSWLQNEKYWGDHRAEFNTYSARIERDGALRECEVIHIFVRESFDTRRSVQTSEPLRAGTIQALQLNQIFEIPEGFSVSRQMHSNYWRTDDGSLLRWSFTGSDYYVNTIKTAAPWKGFWDIHSNTSREDTPALPTNLKPLENSFFYDELPMRVRTIDFTKTKSEFDIQLAPTAISSKNIPLTFQTAHVIYEVGKEAILVSVSHAGGTDKFTLAPAFPYLLLDWKMADGGQLKLKRSLKVDYWNHTKPGDRDRVFSEATRLYPVKKQ